MNLQLRVCLFLMLLAVPCLVWAQEAPVVLLDWEGSGHQYLNALLAADTTANGWVANRTYVLKRDGIYYANATFSVPAGRTLRFRSDYAAATHYKPTVFLVPTGSGGSPQNPPGNFVIVSGDLFMSNILLSGYFEPVDSNLNNLQGALINVPAAGVGANMYIDSCILKSTNGNHIRTDGAPKVVKVTNTIFADMGFLGRSNLGAGKGLDVRAGSVDSLIVERCTFINWQDRIIRHYASTAPIKYMRFNHNTLANGMSYHGMLSLGKVGSKIIITNNLFLDHFSLGSDTDGVRQVEFADGGEFDARGNPRMSWVIANQNDTVAWTISNNYYGVSDSAQAFYNQYAADGVTGEGAPLTYKINQRLQATGGDSVNAFKKVTLKFNKIPALMTVMNRWYRSPAGGRKSKDVTAFLQSATPGKWTYDYNRKPIEYYFDSLNCSFRSSIVLTSTDGLVVGDTRWSYLGSTGVDGTPSVPTEFTLSQNYPNPFNPESRIVYTVPTQAPITLEVFDVLGRKVATLVKEIKQAGVYTVEFNGASLGSGVYIYKLTTPAQTISKKMTLLR